AAGYYTFDEDGKMVTDLDGIVVDDGNWYYYVKGAKTYAGLILIDGDYYYVKSDCTVVHDCTYYISKTNGLMAAGYYTFDEDGKMVTDLDGIVVDDDGNWYYYVKGAKTYAGLILIDGDYYYVKSNCTVVHDCVYYTSKTNDLLPAASYTFDAEGKLVN
ncbi:MAG: hypothetical protein LUH51_04335, partial [Firmicutes bacterium]|nr:hypothetical protein [Bacillota bacterium]